MNFQTYLSRLTNQPFHKVVKFVKENPTFESRLLNHLAQNKLYFENSDGEQISICGFLENFENEELIVACRATQKNHEKFVYYSPKHIYIFRY